MKTNTNSITIGRDPTLTLFIINAIAIRKARKDRWLLWKSKLTFWK